jgi:hypothetical protein
MFTKAIAKALVIVLTVGMTSLVASPSKAMTFADSLTLSSATMSQQLGETLTSNSAIATVTFLSTAVGDTYTITSALVSAPAGNTRLPVLQLFETTSAEVYSGSSPGRLGNNSEVQAGVPAKISPLGNLPVAVSAKFRIHMDAPTKAGTYVVKITPSVVGGGGTLAATAQTLTITVLGTPRIFSDSLTLSSATMSQSAGETGTSSASIVTLSYLSTGLGDTYTVNAILVSGPAGSTALPKLRLTETSNAQIWNSGNPYPLPLNSEIQANTNALVTPSMSGSIAVTAKFQVYMDAPAVSGTYVVMLFPSVASNNSTAATAQTVTITVTGGTSPGTSTNLLTPETSTPDTYTVSIKTSSAIASQYTSRNQTASNLLVTLKAFANEYGDTFSVTAYLMSAPAGNTASPALELVGPPSSETSTPTPQPGGFGGYAVVDPRDNHVCGVTVSASNDPFNNGGYIGSEYMGCPSNSRFVFQTFPSESGNVAGWHGADVILTGNTYSLPGGRTLTNGIVTDPDGRRWNSGTGATISPAISSSAGQSSNIRVKDALSGGSNIAFGELIRTQEAFVSPLSAPDSVTAVFRLFMDSPKKIGTYVIKLLPRVIGGSGTAPTRGLTVTLTVTRDPSTYPVAGEVIISNPGRITNKSDAVISASKAADSINEVAVIRTTMLAVNGGVTSVDSYTAVITGPGVIGSAPLTADINTSAIGKAITVRAGDAVTVYADGTSGVATIIILTFDGIEVGRKTVSFIDLTNQASAILALSFSSFPEKGTAMQLTALVNLPGTVRFTTNGKTLGSCARVAATGSPKTAVCQWKPPLAGSINVVARFTPTDSQIAAVSTTKVLAIGRRSGRR